MLSSSSPIVFILLFAISTIRCDLPEVPINIAKPLCGVCENIVKKMASVLEHGGDIKKVVHVFCEREVPFMVRTCEKIIDKNLEKIIQKLKDHVEPRKICKDILLCQIQNTYYFLETDEF